MGDITLLFLERFIELAAWVDLNRCGLITAVTLED